MRTLTAHDAYIGCPTREQRASTRDSVAHQSVDLVTNPDWSLARWHPQLAACSNTYLRTEQLVNGNVPDPDGNLALVLAGFTLPTVAAGFEEYQGALDGQCTYQNGANWLQITGDTGLFPSSAQTSGLGLHVVDYNIDLGDLTALVARQAAAWLAANGS